MIRILLLLITIVGIDYNLHAQEISEQNWQNEEDYRRAENNVKQNIIWLEENPMATESNDTKAITEYVLSWLTTVPYISVTYDEIFLEGLTTKKYKFGDKFRVTYLFGKSYYVINLPYNSIGDETYASPRGLEGMIKVYQELVKIDPSVKHKLLDKYSRLLRQDKLYAYTENKLTKPKIN